LSVLNVTKIQVLGGVCKSSTVDGANRLWSSKMLINFYCSTCCHIAETAVLINK